MYNEIEVKFMLLWLLSLCLHTVKAILLSFFLGIAHEFQFQANAVQCNVAVTTFYISSSGKAIWTNVDGKNEELFPTNSSVF